MSLQKNTFVGFLPWLMSMSCLRTHPIFQDLWDGSLCTFWLKKRCHRLIWTKIIYSTSFLASWKYLCMCVPTAGCTLAPWERYCPWVFTHLLTLISCRWTPVWLQVPPRNTQQAPGSCPQPLGACQAPFSGFYSPECVGSWWDDSVSLPCTSEAKCLCPIPAYADEFVTSLGGAWGTSASCLQPHSCAVGLTLLVVFRLLVCSCIENSEYRLL